MKDWKDILVELAKKLTPPLAFAVLFIVALAQFGGQIPAEYTRLVYAIGLGLPLLWAAVELAGVLQRARPVEVDKNQQSSQLEVGKAVKKSVIVQGNRNEIQYIVNNYAKGGPRELWQYYLARHRTGRPPSGDSAVGNGVRAITSRSQPG
jgi:hypothetical protein